MAEATRAEGGTAARQTQTVLRDLSDNDAVERSKRGDAAAYKVLVDRYQGRAYRLALRVLRDDELARDACQEAFLKAFLNLKRFEGRSSFYTWLYRLVMNLCLDFKRRDRSNRYVDVPEPADLERIAGSERASHEAEDWRSHTEAPDAALERRELRTAMARAIEQLPASARETLVLREVEGLSYAEIAQVLEIPKGTVMSRLHYARRRVQELLRESEGVDLEEVALAAVEPVAGGSDEHR
jgi:RNA polymerase sigma-70 factor (ECF subfamily)